MSYYIVIKLLPIHFVNYIQAIAIGTLNKKSKDLG